ncbi:DUF2059 domain-containing protein [Desulfosediminicola sp.]|uniref:DUF2059 domain-containing protein n=1 Tax=Desulfosediminicola sp. TaxID=2886825 RepID=UPI003AF2F443
MIKRVLAVLVVLMFSSCPCWASDEKAEDILKLLVITGSLEQAKDIVIYLAQAELAAVSESDDDISKQAIAIIEEETVKILTGQFAAGSPLVSELVNIYAEYFSHDEILEIIAFYESGVGSKMIASMPQIMEKSMLAGQMMGNSITPLLRDNILSRLQQEGIEVPR